MLDYKDKGVHVAVSSSLSDYKDHGVDVLTSGFAKQISFTVFSLS